MIGIAMNGTLGFGMLLTVLFRMGDLDSVLAENPAFPFMVIFHRAVQSRSGAAVMASIVMVLTIGAGVGLSASTSRICWAFARDKGLPGWKTLSKVEPLIFSVPRVSVILHVTGQLQNPNPRPRRPLHKYNRLPPCSHQHWLHHCLQRHHLRRHRRPLLFVPSHLFLATLPPLYRRYRPPYGSYRRTAIIPAQSRLENTCSMGALASPSCFGYRQQRFCMRLFVFCALLQFLA